MIAKNLCLNRARIILGAALILSFARFSNAFDTEIFNGNTVVAHEVLFRFHFSSPADRTNFIASFAPQFDQPVAILGDPSQPDNQWYYAKASGGNLLSVEDLIKKIQTLASATGINVKLLDEEPDYVFHGGDPLSSVEPGMPSLPVLAVSGLAVGSPGVALLDSGVSFDPKMPFAGLLWGTIPHVQDLHDPHSSLKFKIQGREFDLTPNAEGFDAALFSTANPDQFLTPTDVNGHGTHCASILANNLKPGEAPFCILPCRFTDEFGRSCSVWIANALQFVEEANTNMQANIKLVSLSWGGAADSHMLYDTIADAGAHGVTVICSSGNGHEDSDLFERFPAAYDMDHFVTTVTGKTVEDQLFQPALENIVCVASVGESPGNKIANHVLAHTSNYGLNSVHLAARGERWTVPSLTFGSELFSGTSAATAQVSGATARFLAANPTLQLDPLALKGTIFHNVVPVQSLGRFVLTGGFIGDSPFTMFTNPKIQVYACPGAMLERVPGSNQPAVTQTIEVHTERFNGFMSPLLYSASVTLLNSSSPVAGVTINPHSPTGSPNGRVPFDVTVDNTAQKGTYFIKITATGKAAPGVVLSSTATFELALY